jgi:hypothetical protein
MGEGFSVSFMGEDYATTLSIMALRITTFSTMVFIATLSIATLSKSDNQRGVQYNDS